MAYKSLEECLIDLEKNGLLIRIKEEVDPKLEMAAIHLRVFENNGPAILFENVKGSKFRAASNLFGNIERCKFLFKNTFKKIQDLIQLKNDPTGILKNPFRYAHAPLTAITALPKKLSRPISATHSCNISDLPLIQHWPKDGGAFVTMPAVYTEDFYKPGIMKANLGMYRIQLTGNEYVPDKEIGLHYQLHRGIGIHQTQWNNAGKPMKVSVFVGGPPSLPFSAVMPLPEGLPEMAFAGALEGRRTRYAYIDGFCLAGDADFVITGEVIDNATKPEGPFGDHLGYYSLTHPFPVMKVHKVFHRPNPIWLFTVVGRPPQEDTQFGALIHEMTGDAIPAEIPGVHEVHAVDAAGVHPLLLAIGSERYTPYLVNERPQEILTIANHILGTGQLSLAKYLFIANKQNELTTHHEEAFFIHILERINTERDVHFYTKTSIDTLDYSGESINEGSKVVFAASGRAIRKLGTEVPQTLKINHHQLIFDVQLVFKGVLAIQTKKFENYHQADIEIKEIENFILKNSQNLVDSFPLIVLCDNAKFCAENFRNFVWVTFTKSNPSHDIHGVDAYYKNKHWSSKGSIIIDARTKPHHAPALEKDNDVEKKIEKLFNKGGSLYGVLK